MLKINLLIIILISGLLGACGFHKPTDITPLNVSITGDMNSVFAAEFKKHLNAKAAKSLTVKIGKSTQNKRASTYTAGTASSHILTLSIPVTISRDKKLLASVTLTASTVASELSLQQANRLQEDSSYAQLRHEIISKLLRRLNTLK
ncbi:hypothetical protein MNB_SUP05-SYMBIONT-4-1024 [hydrothermal vent metagenome]|uniref:Uncharacterized protein n=1 Tax=hydrothermal vent metagenome TaxID=652676 RepID=A0A1W1DXT7_9ZZZZ